MNTIGERLKDERTRLGLSQSAFAEIGGVKKLAQINYEKGERFPDALYLSNLAKIGVDVLFIVTGQKVNESSHTLVPDELLLLDGYRQLDEATKKRTVAFIWAGENPSIQQNKPLKDRQPEDVRSKNESADHVTKVRTVRGDMVQRDKIVNNR